VFFDLASLTKPLVTARLALDLLDLDSDRRAQLGFLDRREPLTVRQLLSHSSGLPPWLPFTGQSLSDQLAQGFPEGVHILLRKAVPGVVTYSDLNFRMLGELLELETGRPFAQLGAEASGLAPAPWREAPVFVPDGPDAEAWRAARPEVPLPPRSPFLPHDANARAGMRGHAGFGASPEQMRASLTAWIGQGFPRRMAIETARSTDGAAWGLSLQRSMDGHGRFGQLLSRLGRSFTGIHVLADMDDALPVLPEDPEGPAEGSTAWWMHFGYTGPALFVRPEDGACICLLAHRRGPEGELLDPLRINARRMAMLRRFVESQS